MNPSPTPTTGTVFSLASQWPSWTIPVLLLGGVVLLLAILILVLVPFLLRRRMLRRATLDEAQEYAHRKALLTFVKEKSPSKGIAVGLGKFWRGRNLSAADKFVVLNFLFDKQILHPAYSGDPVSSFFQTLWWSILARPPAYVKLSDRDWTQLANGQSINIAIETLIGKQKIGTQKNVTVGDVTDRGRQDMKDRTGLFYFPL